MSTFTADYTQKEKEHLEWILDGQYKFLKEHGFYVAVPLGNGRECDIVQDRDFDFFVGFLVKQEKDA